MASCHCRLTSLRSVEVSTLRQLRRQAVRSLSEDASKTLIQAFVSWRHTLLQPCSSICFSEGLVNQLQSVQNAAASMVTSIRRSDHITPVLRQLHWLPLRQSVDFKVATLVHRSLSDISPSYLANGRRLFADVRVRRL